MLAILHLCIWQMHRECELMLLIHRHNDLWVILISRCFSLLNQQLEGHKSQNSDLASHFSIDKGVKHGRNLSKNASVLQNYHWHFMSPMLSSGQWIDTHWFSDCLILSEDPSVNCKLLSKLFKGILFTLGLSLAKLLTWERVQSNMNN